MIKLGYYLHRVPSGRLIVKISGRSPPRLGSRVINSKGELLGMVIDVIGPVSSPYAVIKPVRPDMNLSRFEEVFVKVGRR